MSNNDSLNILTPSDLGKHIEFLKRKLVKIVQQNGINSERALVLSQELDQYIILCQRCCSKGKCND